MMMMIYMYACVYIYIYIRCCSTTAGISLPHADGVSFLSGYKFWYIVAEWKLEVFA